MFPFPYYCGLSQPAPVAPCIEAWSQVEQFGVFRVSSTVKVRWVQGMKSVVPGCLSGQGVIKSADRCASEKCCDGVEVVFCSFGPRVFDTGSYNRFSAACYPEFDTSRGVFLKALFGRQVADVMVGGKHVWAGVVEGVY